MYDQDGDSVYAAGQVSTIIEDQVINPILQQHAATQQDAATDDCEHSAAWYNRALKIWLFAGWLPVFAATQGWAWAAPGIALWVVTSLIGVAAAIRGVWDSCRRCGKNKRDPR